MEQRSTQYLQDLVRFVYIMVIYGKEIGFYMCTYIYQKLSRNDLFSYRYWMFDWVYNDIYDEIYVQNSG